MSYQPLTPPAPLSGERRSAEPELLVVVPARAQHLPAVRRLLMDWLNGLGWPVGGRADIVLAVHEALENVVAHAYADTVAGSVQLYAWVTVDDERRERRVVAVVTDNGRWAPAVRDPGSPAGRGLRMMTECMAGVHIEPTPAGTTVILTSVPASLPALLRATG